ncbi:MAG: hypothetical protein CMC55_06765 [Flavobacteriaceae bacterium]|nr:hypothetical protein [Flavobacteriaceae bacterium]
MFGFVWKQPIHKTLKDMAILQVGLVISSQIMLIRIVESIEDKNESYTAIALLLIGQIFAAVFGISNKKD